LGRSYDRGAALALLEAGVDYQTRETVEPAFVFGSAALKRLEVADEIMADVRKRDAQLFKLQIAEGLYAGQQFLHGNQPVPVPLLAPKQSGQTGSEETAAVLGTAAAKR
jgi:glutathione-regulated potassium-efflux system protein KefB